MDTVQERIQQWGFGDRAGAGGRSPVISLRELQGQARPYTAHQATPRRHRASGGRTKVGLEGPGEELEEALLCGYKGAIERPGRQRWPWASGRLAWLRSTRGPERGELVAWPAGVQVAMPGPVLPTPHAPLTRGFFHLGLSLSGPSGETPLTSPFPAVLPACGGRVAPQAGLRTQMLVAVIWGAHSTMRTIVLASIILELSP